MRNIHVNVALLLFLVRWSPVTSLTVKSLNSSSRRKCTNDELSEYALMVAVGPARSPRCQPTDGQVLFAQTSAQAVLKPVSGLVTVSSQVKPVKDLHKPAKGVKGGTHFIHLHVVQSDMSWCPLPCDGPSWELAAPKPTKASPYVLLEAVIWRQFRNVTLYQFDAEWETLARNSHQGLCGGKDWACEAYKKHRESKALITIGPWPKDLDWDGPGLSAYIKKAFEKVFSKVEQFAIKDNSQLGITYTGHGGDADGSLFAGVVDSPDAVSLLKGLVSDRGKFSMFNFGTNCQEGHWNMLAAMHPFADYIIASDLDVGGLKHDGSQEDLKSMQAKEKLADVAVLKQVMEARATIDVAVTAIIEKRQELWLSVMKDAITKQKLRQSIAAFLSTKFLGFAASLKATYQKLPVNHQEGASTEADSSDCDVLTIVRYMDSALAASATHGSSLSQQTNATRLSTGPLEAQFLAFRPKYASTQSLFPWKPVTNGLGFNLKGGQYTRDHHGPRCDLEPALGVLGCGPICEKRAKDAKAEEEAQRKHEQKQEEIFQKEMKKVMRETFEREAKDRGSKSSDEKAAEEKRLREQVKAQTLRAK